MITIYTPYITARLNYVLNHVFTHQMGVSWQLTDEIKHVGDNGGILINYSDALIIGACNILPQGLLYGKGIGSIEIAVEDCRDMKVIFKNNSDLGYDIFSALFYCLSRYEEYGNIEKDLHGRYKHTDSFLWKHDCLNRPLVDFWVNDFREILIKDHGFKINDFKPTAFSVLPTIDIDAVFAYKGRNMIRQIAGFGKSFLEFNFKEIEKRLRVTYAGATDPNDNFEYQFEQLNLHRQKACYFIQIGKYGRFDKNIDFSNKSFQKIIRSIVANGHSIGLHPSYQSNSDLEIMKGEKETLENIIDQTVVSSRQHYLRFRLPETFRNLIALGFQKEYSMGYSEVTGFRAGTSKPFYWYDLEREEATGLEIIPFSLMDVAFKQFSNASPESTILQSDKIREIILAVEGTFSFVFHNESLSNHRGWEGWREVFETWLKNENSIHQA